RLGGTCRASREAARHGTIRALLAARTVELIALSLVGFSSETAARVASTAAAIGLILVARVILVGAVRAIGRRQPNDRVMFWVRQGSSLAALLLVLATTVSI